MVTDDPWLDEPQLRAWTTMAVLLEVLPSAIDAQLRRDADLNRFEYTLLAMLSEEDDHTLVMSDLARVAFGSLSRLSHAVTRLEKRGLVERQAGSGGRRHTVVRLTAAGHETIVGLAPRHVAEVRRRFVDPLSADELATLTRLAGKLVAASDPEAHDHLERLIPDVIARNLGTRD